MICKDLQLSLFFEPVNSHLLFGKTREQKAITKKSGSRPSSFVVLAVLKYLAKLRLYFGAVCNHLWSILVFLASSLSLSLSLILCLSRLAIERLINFRLFKR